MIAKLTAAAMPEKFATRSHEIISAGPHPYQNAITLICLITGPFVILVSLINLFASFQKDNSNHRGLRKKAIIGFIVAAGMVGTVLMCGLHL
jgi:hypothetical protein